MSALNVNVREARIHSRFHYLLGRKCSHGWGVKEGYRLALRIASPALQLHTTPWLSERWGLNDFHLVGGSETTYAVDTPHLCDERSGDLNQQPTT